MKRQIILLTFLLFTLSIVTSQEVRFYHEEGQNLTIYEKCRIDGQPCDTTYVCNITILNPVESKIVNGDSMNYGSNYYNYSVLSTLLEDVGSYETTIDCGNGTYYGSNTFYFNVNPLGTEPVDSGQGNILIIAGVFLIILSLFLTYIGLKMINPIATFGFIAFSFLLLFFSIGFMLNILEVTIPGFGNIINNYSVVYRVLVVLMTGAGIGLLLFLVKSTFEKINKLRGIRID